MVSWTFNNSHLISVFDSTQETYTFNTSKGVLLSADLVYNSLNFSVSLVLVSYENSNPNGETTSLITTTPSSMYPKTTTTVNPSSTTTSTTVIPSIIPGFYLISVLMAAISILVRRKKK